MINLSSTFDKVVSYASRKAPDILLKMGIAGVLYGVYEACKETTELHEVIEDHEERKKEAEEVMSPLPVKEVTKLYLRTGFNLVKLYGKSVATLTMSLGCILYSNKILKNRYVALSYAYIALDQSYKEYRRKVIDKYGEAIDLEFAHNAEVKKLKDGTAVVMNKPENSQFCLVFDETSGLFEKNLDMNLRVVNNAIAAAENKARATGTLRLYEFINYLQIPLTDNPKLNVISHTLGFVYDENHPITDKIRIINHNVADLKNDPNRNEPVIVLQLKTDGNLNDISTLYEALEKRNERILALTE